MTKAEIVSREEVEAQRRHERILKLRNAAEQTFLDLGKELYEFKANRDWERLGHTSFNAYIADPDVDIAHPVASKLMAIYEAWVKGLGFSPEKILPAGYNKLYMVTPYLKLAPPKELLGQAATLGKRDLEEWLAERFPRPTPPLPEGSFMVRYADPPWAYDNSGFDQSANKHYPVMTPEALIALGEKLPPAQVLFLWVTSPMLDIGVDVLRGWGFTYKASMVWRKNRFPGLAFWTETYHELLLIGATEDAPRPKIHPPSVLEAPVSQHSKKPPEFYGIIEAMFDGPYLELFARQKRTGWEAWGNELS